MIEAIGLITGALLALWLLLHVAVVIPLRRWLRKHVHGHLVEIEQRLDDHIMGVPQDGPYRLRSIGED